MPRLFFNPMKYFLAGSVDCEVEDWSLWSDCSVTCGGGTKTRGRGVVQEAEHGGSPCPALEHEETCNNHRCSGFFYNLRDKSLFFQLAAKLTIGHLGPTAARPVEVEPRQE